MGEYVSPIDGHRHFGDAGRADCAVCCLEAERDRLGAVVDVVRDFAAADSAWHAKIERGENVRSTDDESRRRAGAILTLLDAVRQLDGSEVMGGQSAEEPDRG